MLKIWAKTLKNDKITRDYLYRKEARYDSGKLTDYLMELCHEMDIPTPIVLKSHRFNFSQFNILRFKEDDFVETIDFENLTLENISD